MKRLLLVLFCTPFLICMETPFRSVGQKLSEDKIKNLKPSSSDSIDAGTLVAIRNGMYIVGRVEAECRPGVYAVITNLNPKSGKLVDRGMIYLLPKEKKQ